MKKIIKKSAKAQTKGNWVKTEHKEKVAVNPAPQSLVCYGRSETEKRNVKRVPGTGRLIHRSTPII